MNLRLRAIRDQFTRNLGIATLGAALAGCASSSAEINAAAVAGELAKHRERAGGATKRSGPPPGEASAFIVPESQLQLIQVSILGREDSNGTCKTPQMDRRGDQAADRTRAAEGKSARDGERAWTSHRLR
jgi:hypothetical protein